MSATRLDERYGRRPPSARRRSLALAAAGLAVALALAALVWAGVEHATPAVQSRLLTWRVVDAGTVTVQAEVSVREGVRASCEVLARAADHAVVGRRTVEVPAGAQRRLLLDERIATSRPATNAELAGCTADGQPQRR